MPAKDTFGSQPPLELIKQWIDYGFWYDRQKQTVKQIKVSVGDQFGKHSGHMDCGIFLRPQRRLCPRHFKVSLPRVQTMKLAWNVYNVLFLCCSF